MSLRVLFGAAALSLLGLGGCSEVGPSASEEVAGELRALRLALAARPAAVSSPTDSRAEVATAMAPLREGLTAMTAAQGEQAARQLALAQEMQRWQQLLVEAVGASRADETKAQAERLAALEQQLREQDARHKEVEALLLRALDQTSDRLEQFLQRLQGLTPEPPLPSPPGNGRAGDPGPAVPAGSGAAPAERRVGATRSGFPMTRWAWLGVTVLGAGVAFVCLRRARRVAVLPTVAPTGTPPADSGKDRSAEEIWAAAALLGEAVGRLREGRAGATTPPAADEQDLFVVVDESDPLLQPEPEPEPAPPPRASPPPAFVVRCGSAAGEARVLALLAADARVLRRPAPASCAVGDAPGVRFHLLPGLPGGEQAELLANLRANAD